MTTFLNSFDTPRVVPLWLKLWIFFRDPLAIISTAFMLMGGLFSLVFITILLAEGPSIPFWLILIPLIFPLIGFFIFRSSFLKARKHIHLVTNGLLSQGQVLDRESTNITINKRRVYKIHFRFKAHDRQMYDTFIKSHLLFWIEDGTSVQILYDPQLPSSATLTTLLPDAAQRLLTPYQ